MKNFKIKISVLTFLVVLLSHLSLAQEWGEIGSKWVYSRTNLGPPQLVKYEITGDTMVNNVDSKIIQSSILYFDGIDTFTFLSETFSSQLIFSTIGDSIYWYNNGAFQFLYDFSPTIGDEWETMENPSFSCMNSLPSEDVQTVISIGSQNMNGVDIEIIELIEGKDWTLGKEIYQNIGPTTSFVPFPGENCQGIDIAAHTTALYCFTSPSFGNIQFFTLSDIQGYTGCDDLVSTDEKPHNNSPPISIYPNPVNNQTLFILKQIETKIEQIRLYDITGKLMKLYDQPGEQIEVSSTEFTNGIYFLQFIGAEKIIFETKKIIIHHD